MWTYENALVRGKQMDSISLCGPSTVLNDGGLECYIEKVRNKIVGYIEKNKY